MSDGRQIRDYDYVNHPYARVRDVLLSKDAPAVFQSATKAASSRARSIASELRVDISGIAVEADIIVSVKSVQEQASDRAAPITHIQLEWQAAKAPGLFPLMKADLAIYPLTANETQLDFSGNYEPPFGAIGKALDAVVGYRIAEASVHRFVNDVAGYLRQALVK